MANVHDIEAALKRVKDQESFLQELLVRTLEWPLDEQIERIDDIAYGWSADDLRAQSLNAQLLEGQIWQVQPLRQGQPWGIFLLQFRRPDHFGSKHGLTGTTGTLRKVLRGLVPCRRRDPRLSAWNRENLLFICTHDYQQFRFAYFKAPADKTLAAPLSAFGWNRGDTHVRTLCQFNLSRLSLPLDGGVDATAWVAQWSAAFDVEVVTKRFFAEYHQVFETVEAGVKGVPPGEPRRLYVQRLFNRLMFLYFIQRKGWLTFQGDKNYLRALFNAASEPRPSPPSEPRPSPPSEPRPSPPSELRPLGSGSGNDDFLNDRLYWTFFHGLNTAGEAQETHSHESLKEKRGDVPFLNGGLFDLEDDYDVRYKVTIPNAAFAAVFDLFDRYNFTVLESTPLDIEVAVDPEMLGKVFEELVTGRHESGSYYTPRPIVAFMCREALKHYLGSVVNDETAIARFVDEGDPAKLSDPEAVLNALRAVKVCDPACGSGAYLLGMMQELLRLRDALFATRGLDAVTVYSRKLEIIQNNLYGVDLDLFAVNIAKLRLWLSLAIDFDGAKPPPLPNLDFKIECGDSLTAPDPQKIDDLFRQVLIESADRLADLKGKYLQTYGSEKKKLAQRIKSEETKLRDGLSEHSPDGSVDWRVAFAEVFRNGGFDIALENPPYVRMELFKEAKPTLRRNFPEVYDGSADLYVYFFARTYQILRPGGTACFISSNKWLKAGYGEALRRFFAESAWVDSVVDFGHAKQIFQEADVFPSILVLRKPSAEAPPPTAHVCAIPREQLRLDDLTRQVQADGFEIPRNRLGAAPWTLEPPAVFALLEKIRRTSTVLKEFARISTRRGVTTGCNDAFLIDTATRNRLIQQDAKSSEIIFPYLRGQDVTRWSPDWAGLWMIFTRRGIDINAFPAIKTYLAQFRKQLEPKPTDWHETTWPGRKPGQYKWFEIQDSTEYWEEFKSPKLVYPEITWRAEWAFDSRGTFASNTVYFVVTSDTWILAVANSPAAWWYAWRNAVHGKDEALRYIGEFVQQLPIPKPSAPQRHETELAVLRLIQLTAEQQAGRKTVLDWLRLQFSIEKPSQKLQDVATLAPDTLATEVQKAVGKKKPLSVAQLKALKAEHTRGVLPLQALAAEARQLEQRIAELVNAAYGLTAAEVALMWQTAPPRMPGEPPGV